MRKPRHPQSFSVTQEVWDARWCRWKIHAVSLRPIYNKIGPCNLYFPPHCHACGQAFWRKLTTASGFIRENFIQIHPTHPARPPTINRAYINSHQIYAKQTKKLTKYILIQVGFKFPGSKENWKGVNTKVTTEKASILEANLSMPHFFLRPPLFSMGQTYIEIPWGGFTGRSGCQTISIADSSISNDLWSLSCLLHRIASREGHFSPGGFIRALIRLVRWQEVA